MLYAAEGYDQAFGTYSSNEGKRVLDSFVHPTPSYGHELQDKMVWEAVTTVGGGALIKGAGLKLPSVLASGERLKSNLQQRVQAFRSAPELEYRQLQNDVEHAVNNYNRIARQNGNPVSTSSKLVEGFTPTKDQPWSVREGQEYKLKIFGRGQKTGPGHDVRSYIEGYKAAQQPDVKEVYLNQGINKVTGAKKVDPHYIQPNRRPDVTIKRNDGRIDQIEVPSSSDRPKALKKRMNDTKSKLPENMQGEVDIKLLNNKD